MSDSEGKKKKHNSANKAHTEIRWLVDDGHEKLKWLPSRHATKEAKHAALTGRKRSSESKQPDLFFLVFPWHENVPLLVVLDSKAQGGSKNTYRMSC